MTRSSITSSKSSGKTNTANSTSFITTKSTFPRSTATTSSCYPPDREFQPRPENFSHSSSIVKPLTTSSVYASVIKPSPNPSVPACNNCLSPNTATKVPSPSSIPPTFSTTASPVQVGRYHSWIVNPHTLPSCLRISALDEEGHIMSFYHTSLPIRGVQYHPESIITRQGRQMINNWVNN